MKSNQQTGCLVALVLVSIIAYASAACTLTCGGSDQCCEFTPPGLQSPIQACYNDNIYNCLSDEVTAGKNCLCADGDGCYKSACYDSSIFQVINDLNGSGNKCLCKANPPEYCHNNQCFVDSLYDLVEDPVLGTKQNCPQGLQSCNRGCYNTNIYKCCVKSVGDGYLEQSSLNCRPGYTPSCQAPVEAVTTLSKDGFVATLDTCARTLTFTDASSQTLCTSQGNFVTLLDIYIDTNGIPAVITRDGSNVASVYNPTGLSAGQGSCEMRSVVYPTATSVCFSQNPGSTGLVLSDGTLVDNRFTSGRLQRVQFSATGCSIIGRSNGFTDDGVLQFAWIGLDTKPYGWVFRPPSNNRDQYIVIRPRYNAGSVKLVDIVG